MEPTPLSERSMARLVKDQRYLRDRADSATGWRERRRWEAALDRVVTEIGRRIFGEGGAEDLLDRTFGPAKDAQP